MDLPFRMNESDVKGLVRPAAPLGAKPRPLDITVVNGTLCLSGQVE